ncbi:hypothetical protein CEQ90_10620 [Lewinellaceae bacterium SD302]|nr:hypothetical protein CEQ90_10620 [Lewinellaceae bacterium SD302]
MEYSIKTRCHRLIKQMSKSEKRNFKLFAGRQGEESPLFVRLFDAMAAQKEPDEEALLREIAQGNATKLANLKRHLYQQLLVSLRLIHLQKEEDLDVRRRVDFARILYSKGLVLDALRTLEKARDLADRYNFDYLLSEILEFQKLIEARHVTRSRQVKNKMDRLVEESQERAERNLRTSFQSNINIQIQGYYILNGHARNQVQREKFLEFWKVNRERFVGYPNSPPTFFELANASLASMWRNYILLDFSAALEDAENCYNRFNLDQKMKVRDPDFFVRSIYYANAFSFLVGDERRANNYADRLNEFYAARWESLNRNSQSTALVYRQICRLNVHLTRRDWSVALEVINEMLNDQVFEPGNLPAHRRNLIRYKFAAVYFALGDYAAADQQLQDIQNSSTATLRDDLIINTRLMQAIGYLESGDFYLADYAIDNLSRTVRRNHYAGKVHTLTLATLRKLVKEKPADWPPLLEELKSQLATIKHEPYEEKCLRFFEVIYWLEGR